jgi:nucleoside diphosphate kinase
LGDEFTKKHFQLNGGSLEKTFLLIKPDAYLQIGAIITDIEIAGFRISKVKMS